jgi:hypothetical protein
VTVRIELLNGTETVAGGGGAGRVVEVGRRAAAVVVVVGGGTVVEVVGVRLVGEEAVVPGVERVASARDASDEP